MLAALALRNLFRNRRRTILSMVVVAVGTAGLLLTVGFIRYSFDGLSEAIIHGGLAHLEVAPDVAGGTGNQLVDRAGAPPGLEGWRSIQDRIERLPGVLAATGAVQIAGVLANGDRSMAFVGAAVEPARQRRMGITVKVRAGEPLADADPVPGDDSVLLGVDLARALDVTPGDLVVAMVATPGGSLNALDLTVRGIVTTGFQDLDGRFAALHLATAQRLLETDAVTSILVGLTDTALTGPVSRAVEATLAGSLVPLAVTGWEARAPFYGQVRGLYLGIFVFLGTIIAVLVVLATSNTLLMSVLERVREFGMLLALGTERRLLAGLLVLEAVWLALFGGLAGAALTVAVVATLDALRIEMPPPPAAVDPITLAVTIRLPDYALALAFMVALLAVGAVPPILRILRLRVVEALGHV